MMRTGLLKLTSGGLARAINSLAVKEEKFAMEMVQHGLRGNATQKWVQGFLEKDGLSMFKMDGTLTAFGEKSIHKIINEQNLSAKASWEDILSSCFKSKNGFTMKLDQMFARVDHVQEKQLAELKDRLTKLNKTTALNRFPGDNERFGKDGIESILSCANTNESLATINKKLDELEQGSSVWTYNIVQAVRKQKNMDPALERPLAELEARLTELNKTTAPNRFPGDNERFGKDGIESILQSANTEERIAAINKELDKLEQGKSIYTADLVPTAMNLDERIFATIARLTGMC